MGTFWTDTLDCSTCYCNDPATNMDTTMQQAETETAAPAPDPTTINGADMETENIPTYDQQFPSLGGGEAHKKLDAIMNNTGTKIEMSSSKDKSLTFLLTGKPDAVLKAKREVLVSFQTQA